MWINIQRAAGLLLVLALPVSVTPPTEPGRETSVSLYGATGNYGMIVQGCHGPTRAYERPFEEIGLSISHRLPLGDGGNGIVFAVNADWITLGPAEQTLPADSGPSWPPRPQVQQARRVRVLNPTIGFDGTLLGAGIGMLWADDELPQRDFERSRMSSHTRQVSWYLRLGKPKAGFVDVAAYHTAPLVSIGYYRVGLGRHGSVARGWLGISAAPFNSLGLLARVDVRVWRSFWMNGAFRLGTAARGVREHTLTLGGTHRWGR